MKRIDRVGRRTLICMAVLIVIALVAMFLR
jgi:hypothetical protein